MIDNEDWLRTRSWNLPTDLAALTALVGDPRKLLHLPCAQAMPAALRAQIEHLEGKYSPDQPRDDHGRFGETGDSYGIVKPGTTSEVARQLQGTWVTKDSWKSRDGKVLATFDPTAKGVDRDTRERVVSRLADLRATNPLSHTLSAVITTEGFTPGEYGRSYGSSNGPSYGGGIISINAHGLMPFYGDRVTSAGSTGFFVPAAETDPADYLVTHEYGHQLDEDKGFDKAAMFAQALEDTPDPSKYSATNPGEAYAEAFADFHLGGTSERGRAFAAIDGWK